MNLLPLQEAEAAYEAALDRWTLASVLVHTHL
jgi:hypothetical protein